LALHSSLVDSITENLRFLLWQSRVAHDDWPHQLAVWAGCKPEHAWLLLQGLALPTPDELARVARATDVTGDELQFARLVEEANVNVLQANLAYLQADLVRGAQRPFARALGVTEGTMSRWFTGAQEPELRHLAALSEKLGIDSKLDLRFDPLFLSPVPATDAGRRAWLKSRLNTIDRGRLLRHWATLELIFGS
jgi:hypothetical protein